MKSKKRSPRLKGRVGRCPYCGSTNVRYRKRTDDYRCRACGEEFTPHL